MSRWIDAEALKEKYTMVIKRYSGGIMERPAVLLETIDDAPSIDIVRCKDCKHKTYCYGDVLWTNKRQTVDIHKTVDFCSYGEREGEPLDYCKKRNCVWWSRSLRICLAEQNGLVCKCKSGKE